MEQQGSGKSTENLGSEKRLREEDQEGQPEETQQELQQETPQEGEKKRKLEDGTQKECKYWALGMCKFGNACRSIHSADVKVTAKGKELCKFFQSGTCKFGDRCKSFHFLPALAQRNYNPISPGMAVANQQAAMAAFVGFPPPPIPSMGFPNNQNDPSPTPIMRFAPSFTTPPASASSLNNSSSSSSFSSAATSSSSPFVLPFQMGTVTSYPQSASSSSNRPHSLLRSTASESSSSRRKNEPCTHFARGECKFGARCDYLHDPGLAQSISHLGPQSIKARHVCEHFLRGQCKYGSICRQIHPPPTVTPPIPPNMPITGLRLRGTNDNLMPYNPYPPPLPPPAEPIPPPPFFPFFGFPPMM